MNKYFDHDVARNRIEDLYLRERGAASLPIIRPSELKDKDAFAFHSVQYPPSIRVMDKDEGEEQEVVMKMIGVMCGGILPPVQRQLPLRSLNSIRNLRQQVKITGLGSAAFDADLSALQELRNDFQQHIGGNHLGYLEFLPYEGYGCVEAHCRYFTERKHAPYDKNIPFPNLLDPHRILSDIQPAEFIRGPDNCVEYCQEVLGSNSEISYTAIDPSIIKPGDIVEVAFVCVAVPVKGNQHRMLLTLRAVTLVCAELRQAAEQRMRDAKVDNSRPTTVTVKRRRLYVDMDKPSDRQYKRVRGESASGGSGLGNLEYAEEECSRKPNVDEGKGAGDKNVEHSAQEPRLVKSDGMDIDIA